MSAIQKGDSLLLPVVDGGPSKAEAGPNRVKMRLCQLGLPSALLACVGIALAVAAVFRGERELIPWVAWGYLPYFLFRGMRGYRRGRTQGRGGRILEGCQRDFRNSTDGAELVPTAEEGGWLSHEGLHYNDGMFETWRQFSEFSITSPDPEWLQVELRRPEGDGSGPLWRAPSFLLLSTSCVILLSGALAGSFLYGLRADSLALWLFAVERVVILSILTAVGTRYRASAREAFGPRYCLISTKRINGVALEEWLNERVKSQ